LLQLTQSATPQDLGGELSVSLKQAVIHPDTTSLPAADAGETDFRLLAAPGRSHLSDPNNARGYDNQLQG